MVAFVSESQWNGHENGLWAIPLTELNIYAPKRCGGPSHWLASVRRKRCVMRGPCQHADEMARIGSRRSKKEAKMPRCPASGAGGEDPMRGPITSSKQRCQPEFLHNIIDSTDLGSAIVHSLISSSLINNKICKNVGNLCSQEGIYRQVGRNDNRPVAFGTFVPPFRHFFYCFYRQQRQEPASAAAAAYSAGVCSCHRQACLSMGQASDASHIQDRTDCFGMRNNR